MNKKVIFFEVQGGNDKEADGYRKDTMPMVTALHNRGWQAEVVFFSIENREQIYKYVKEHAIAYVSRINPGNLKEESEYFDMLRQLCKDGIIGMPHPDAMKTYGAKDALTKLSGLPIVPADTYAYYSIEHFKENFPKALVHSERVLKQNRGSAGEGIWRVELLDVLSANVTSVPETAKIKCTEAKDNHVEIWELAAFMDFCNQYIIGENGMLIDMPFLPRIKEGEIRLFMLRNKPINVVHKKPKEEKDAFSATLFSGAQYRYDSPNEWKELIEQFSDQLPDIISKLGNFDLPLIWTADFILDYDEQMNNKYILGEMNCSCVGFTSHLELAENIADEIIDIIDSKSFAK
ncbi:MULTISPECIES: Cj0069 family protein [Bacillus]|uniref:Cj0069 family protein n=1 Tax=Bacillus TaxID=1386 RepID=UPI0002EFFFE5|nr:MULTISPECIES: Cj0069 family protein [Bacillus]